MRTHKSETRAQIGAALRAQNGAAFRPFTFFPFCHTVWVPKWVRYLAPIWVRVFCPKTAFLRPRVSSPACPWLLKREPSRGFLWLHAWPPPNPSPTKPILRFDGQPLGSCGQEDLGYITVRCSSNPKKIRLTGEARLDMLICQTCCDVPLLKQVGNLMHTQLKQCSVGTLPRKSAPYSGPISGPLSGPRSFIFPILLAICTAWHGTASYPCSLVFVASRRDKK